MSLVTHALSTRQRLRVLNADTPLLWNLMWPPIGGRPTQPDGTFYFNNQPNQLDQFLVNKHGRHRLTHPRGWPHGGDHPFRRHG
jgi:hypothetical protein